MDSLLASYASSDDEPEHEKEGQEAAGSLSKPSASISTQLPPLKSKLSLFSSLPPPKTYAPSSSSSLFASLPLPSQSNGSKPIRSQPSSNPNPKRVVQFTLPLNPSLLKPGEFDDDDEEEEEEERKPIKDSSESTSSKALSSMLPAPRNSLCLAPSAASRRSVVDSDVNSSSSNRERFEGKQESSNFEHLGSSNVEESEGGEQERGSFEGYESYPVEQGASGHENYASYDGYENYGIYGNGYGSGSGGGGDYGSYEGNWGDGNATTAVAPPTLIPELGRIGGKRKRNEIPAEIVEVNQAELIKNRPRQDQAKLTGIAFGPAYQPVSTSKGKPSKLHKRKHQIGTLFYDMKQKEMELAERRSKGFLTKAETQAKYGW